MVEYNLVALRADGRAALVHLRDVVHLVGVVNGAAHQPQGGHTAARGFNLGKNQEGDNDRHQGVGKRDGKKKKKCWFQASFFCVDLY